MVAWKDRRVVDVPIDEGIRTYKNVERKDSLVETALSLGIYIGDEVKWIKMTTNMHRNL